MNTKPEFTFPVVNGMVAVEHVRYMKLDLEAAQTLLAGEIARHTEAVSALEKLLELASPKPNQPKEYYDAVCHAREHTVQRARNAIRAYEMDGGRLEAA